MEDSRRTAVMFMHLSWRRKRKEKKGKGKRSKEARARGGEEGGAGRLGLRQVALVSELVGRSQKARQRLGTGWRSIWNNPAFRRLYAWRLWLVCLQKTSDEDMAGSAAWDRRDPPFLGGAGRRELF